MSCHRNSTSAITQVMRHWSQRSSALAFEPKLLLMDEPFGALDEITRNKLDEDLRQLWGERFPEAAARLQSSHIFELYETGGLSTEEFVDALRFAAGTPLTDEDRWPWLTVIGARMADALARGEGILVSCSALKTIYRDHLRAATGGRLSFVYLEGTRDLLARRMGARTGHFMPLTLLDSQLATLEVPTGEPGVVTVSIDQPVEGIVADALAGLDA